LTRYSFLEHQKRFTIYCVAPIPRNTHFYTLSQLARLEEFLSSWSNNLQQSKCLQSVWTRESSTEHSDKSTYCESVEEQA
jgi:hypothetical protein